MPLTPDDERFITDVRRNAARQAGSISDFTSTIIDTYMRENPQRLGDTDFTGALLDAVSQDDIEWVGSQIHDWYGDYQDSLRAIREITLLSSRNTSESIYTDVARYLLEAQGMPVRRHSRELMQTLYAACNPHFLAYQHDGAGLEWGIENWREFMDETDERHDNDETYGEMLGTVIEYMIENIRCFMIPECVNDLSSRLSGNELARLIAAVHAYTIEFDLPPAIIWTSNEYIVAGSPNNNLNLYAAMNTACPFLIAQPSTVLMARVETEFSQVPNITVNISPAQVSQGMRDILNSPIGQIAQSMAADLESMLVDGDTSSGRQIGEMRVENGVWQVWACKAQYSPAEWITCVFPQPMPKDKADKAPRPRRRVDLNQD